MLNTYLTLGLKEMLSKLTFTDRGGFNNFRFGKGIVNNFSEALFIL